MLNIKLNAAGYCIYYPCNIDYCKSHRLWKLWYIVDDSLNKLTTFFTFFRHLWLNSDFEGFSSILIKDHIFNFLDFLYYLKVPNEHHIMTIRTSIFQMRSDFLRKILRQIIFMEILMYKCIMWNKLLKKVACLNI